MKKRLNKIKSYFKTHSTITKEDLKWLLEIAGHMDKINDNGIVFEKSEIVTIEVIRTMKAMDLKRHISDKISVSLANKIRARFKVRLENEDGIPAKRYFLKLLVADMYKLV